MAPARPRSGDIPGVEWPPPKPPAPPGSMIVTPDGDDVLAALRREVEQLRVAVDPAKVDAVKRLVASATRLVRIERDDARARAETAEAAIVRVRELHYPVNDGRWCNACTNITGSRPTSWPCPTIRALDGHAEGADRG